MIKHTNPTSRQCGKVKRGREVALGHPSLTIGIHHKRSEEPYDSKRNKHDVVPCYCGIHREAAEYEAAECGANRAKCTELHMIVIKMKRQAKAGAHYCTPAGVASNPVLVPSG